MKRASGTRSEPVDQGDGPLGQPRAGLLVVCAPGMPDLPATASTSPGRVGGGHLLSQPPGPPTLHGPWPWAS